MKQAVDRWLAQSGESTSPSGISAVGTVERSGDDFALDLQLVTPGGKSREQLRATRCETLAEVVALKIALAASPAISPRQLARPSASLQVAARLSASYAAGLLPQSGPMIHFGTQLRFASLPLSTELEVGYGFASTSRYDDRPNLGARLDLLSVGARLCVLPTLWSLELPFCAGVDLGWMRGTGFGPMLERSLTSTQPYRALIFSPALRWPVSRRFAARLGVDMLAMLTRPSFQIRGLPTLFRPESFAARLTLGLEWVFN